jgi:hypothetical protein
MGDELSEDDIEAMAWELETKMMEIRKDPRAALTAGLARIWSIMHAETKAYWEKVCAAREAKMAEDRAELETEMAEDRAELKALMAARREEIEAEADALMFRLRQVNTREEAQRFCSEMETRGDLHAASEKAGI